MPYLYSKRLRLRAAEPNDIPHFLDWVNDPEVTENLVLHQPISSIEEEHWYENMLKRPIDEHVMVIEIKKEASSDSGAISWVAIGNIQFLSINWINRNTEIGIMIGEKEYWGQGYGTEAMQLMLTHGFSTLNLHRIWLQVYDKNVRGFKAYEKAGFVTEGRLREAHYQQGTYNDVIIMSVLKDNWISRKV
ncbi:MAG: GNAT family N-acetyltransferase [Anaerolineaceae bacterium]|nr:GNAT family N-acetyltransferase [Anaerolineaceae bacterium]